MRLPPLTPGEQRKGAPVLWTSGCTLVNTSVVRLRVAPSPPTSTPSCLPMHNTLFCFYWSLWKPWLMSLRGWRPKKRLKCHFLLRQNQSRKKEPTLFFSINLSTTKIRTKKKQINCLSDSQLCTHIKKTDNRQLLSLDTKTCDTGCFPLNLCQTGKR